MSSKPRVIIVGAGLAGLHCAVVLAERGTPSVVLDQADAVGGRVRTDAVDGFLLDRGFQVLLTAYPTARDVFDYGALDLRAFDPGALVFTGERLHRVGDPLRRPASLPGTMAAPIGTIADKVRMLRLRQALLAGEMEDLFIRPERTTLEVLRERWGFSELMIERFFRPFIGGVTFDPELRTSSRFFEFVMRMFASGEAAVPARGMQRLPEQLAARLDPDAVRLGVGVVSATADRVILDDGSNLEAEAVVVATGGADALTEAAGEQRRTVHATSVYFAAPGSPVGAPMLVLDGDRSGPATNVAVLSDVSPHYAPEGRALVCASVPGDPEEDDALLVRRVRAQLRRWFGASVDGWDVLRTYRILHALPDQAPPALAVTEREAQLSDGRFICGDHRDHGSIEGALRSGLRAAEAVEARFRT